MACHAPARTAGTGSGAVRYQRHRPEQTHSYGIVEQHYPAFTASLAAQARELPGSVRREFENYLNGGRLEHGFPARGLRVLRLSPQLTRGQLISCWISNN